MQISLDYLVSLRLYRSFVINQVHEVDAKELVSAVNDNLMTVTSFILVFVVSVLRLHLDF